jgi:hypothetical protein
MDTTKTSNTFADLNICLAADDIIEIFESFGFTTDTPMDVESLRHLITEAIQNRITSTQSSYDIWKNKYPKEHETYRQLGLSLKPNKNAKVPEYDYLTEGFDPSKLPKKKI